MVSDRCSGSRTRSYRPGSVVGAFTFSTASRCDAWGLGEEIRVLDQFIAHPKMRRIEGPRGESPAMHCGGIEIPAQSQEVEFQARSFS